MLNNEKIYVKRSIFNKIAKHLDNEEITLIIGPRQVGKTVLLQQLQKHLISKQKISHKLIYNFNLDVIQDRELFQDQEEFIEFLKTRSQRKKIYVFVDEAQKIAEAGVFFKGVYDSNLNIKLVLTGSSNLEIRSKIHESLAGRKRVFHLLPFSFLEILNFKNQDLAKLISEKLKIVPYDHRLILKEFFNYCIWGGYPQIALNENKEEKEQFLREIFSSYIEKDIIGFLKIQNEMSFVKLIKLLAAQIGNLINIAELSAAVQKDRFTIERYLINLEKTFVIFSLQPYASNTRQEIIKAKKIFFIDNGLRNLSLRTLQLPLDSRVDRGALLENTIFKELLNWQFSQNFSLKFWRSKQKAEVDFIIEKGLEIVPIEVKSSLKNLKLPASLIGFIKRYSPKKALVVNFNIKGVRKIQNTEVNFIYPYEICHYI